MKRKLALNTPRLRKINSRPALEGGKRFKGQLIFKALDDGKSILEYTSEGGSIGTKMIILTESPIVLKSSRIRHMVVQPNEGGAITLIHIYLVKPIRIGKHVKKTQVHLYSLSL
jgi:nucleosome binding factor SPN SPT16 subunit